MSEPIPDDAVDPGEPATPQDVEGADPQRLHLHMPVDVRSVSLAVLAVLGIIFALHWASAVFIPLFLGLTCSYALAPAVDRLERMRVPRAIGAAFLLIGIVGGMGWTVYSLSDDATVLIESLPDAAQKVRQAMRARRHSESAIDRCRRRRRNSSRPRKKAHRPLRP